MWVIKQSRTHKPMSNIVTTISVLIQRNQIGTSYCVIQRERRVTGAAVHAKGEVHRHQGAGRGGVPAGEEIRRDGGNCAAGADSGNKSLVFLWMALLAVQCNLIFFWIFQLSVRNLKFSQYWFLTLIHLCSYKTESLGLSRQEHFVPRCTAVCVIKVTCIHNIDFVLFSSVLTHSLY